MEKIRYDVKLQLVVDDCIGATPELLKQYIEYKLGLSVSKFKPLEIDNIKIVLSEV